MTLDVLIPTLNRAALLERTLRSLLSAAVPSRLAVSITVINNGCTDGTAAVAERFILENPGRIQVVHERRRGKSRALNAGIAATRGELVGMIDDDEEIGRDWYTEVFQAFQDPAIDFIGGPYIAEWAAPPPDWVPTDYLAVLGAADSGSEPLDYSPDFPGILKGGNAIIRRSTLERAGPYAEYLGPSEVARLLSCEDEDMYYRLLRIGARGRYLPSLVIHHHVLVERLSPAYYRRWCFWRGVSRGLMDPAHRLPVEYLAGVPRFLYGRAARGLARVAQGRLRREPWLRNFGNELPLWDLAGYAWGRHVYPLARWSPFRSQRTPPDACPPAVAARRPS